MLEIKEFMGAYYIEGARSNRLYPSYAEAEKALNRIMRARKKYRDLMNISISYRYLYDDILGSGSMDGGAYANGEAEEGFFNAYSDNWYDTNFSMTVEDLFKKAINDNDITILKLLSKIYINTANYELRKAIRTYASFSNNAMIKSALGSIFTWTEV